MDMPFIIITPDEVIEDVEKFTVTLQNPVGGFINPNEPSTTSVYILDETGKIRAVHNRLLGGHLPKFAQN